MTETIIWLIAFIVLVLIEAVTLSLLTIWFSAGALAACIVSMVTDNVYIQLFVFLFVSIAVMFFLRPSAVRYFNQHRTKTNYESIIGLEAKVIEKVDNNEPSGKAMINGMEWMARSAMDDVVIEAGTKARVVKISGVKLILSIQKEEI